MIAAAGLRSGLMALLSTLVSILAFVIWPAGAQAQLVDTPANLVKAWADAYATRLGEPMGRVYASDAQLWGSQSKEASSGIANIKQHYERTGQNVAERSAQVTKVQFHSRKRVTTVTGFVDLKAKLKDGTLRSNPARFSMTIVRESRRQWAIFGHHVSFVPN